MERLRQVNPSSRKLVDLEARLLQNAQKPSFPKSTNIFIFNACKNKSAHKTLAKLMRRNFPNVSIDIQYNWLQSHLRFYLRDLKSALLKNSLQWL